MNNEQLIKFIEDQVTSGVQKDQIIRSLINEGSWSQVDVEKAFLIYSEKHGREKKGGISSSTVSSQRNITHLAVGSKKILILSCVTIMFLVVIGLVLFTASHQKSNMGDTIGLVNVEDIYKQYCVGVPEPVPSEVNVTVVDRTFDELYTAIMESSPAEVTDIGLIRLSLILTLDPLKISSTRIFADNLADSNNFQFESKYISDDDLLNRVAYLQKLFELMSKDSSAITIEIENDIVYLTGLDVRYFDVYNYYVSPGTEVDAEEILEVLAQLSILFDLTDEKMETARIDWSKRLDSYISTSTTVTSLVAELSMQHLPKVEAGLPLGVLGHRLFFDGQFEDGLRVLECAAEQYYDNFAMYNLARDNRAGKYRERFRDSYSSSTDEMSSIPNYYLTDIPLPNNPNESLFWALSLEEIDKITYKTFGNADYRFGWNNIGLIDSIVNSEENSKIDNTTLDCRIRQFILKKYPSFVDNLTNGRFACSTASGDDVSNGDSLEEYLVAIQQLSILNELSLAKDVTLEQQQKFQSVAVKGVNAAQLAVDTVPSSPQNWEVLGSIYKILAAVGVDGAYERSFEALTKAKELDTSDYGMYLLIAQLESQAGNYESARQYAEDAILLKPDYVEALFLLIQVDVSEGDIESAVISAKKYIDLEPSNPAGYYQLGVLHSTSGDTNLAITAFEKVNELDPGYSNAAYFLELLRAP